MALLKHEAVQRPHPLHSAGLTLATVLTPLRPFQLDPVHCPEGAHFMHLPHEEHISEFTSETKASFTTLPRDMGMAALAAAANACPMLSDISAGYRAPPATNMPSPGNSTGLNFW